MEDTLTTNHIQTKKIDKKEFLKNISSTLKKIEDAEIKINGFKANYEKAKNQFKTSGELDKKVSKLLSDIQEKKNIALNNFKEINTFYDKEYSKLKENISNPKTGFDSTIKQVAQKVTVISKNEEKAIELLSDLKKSVGEYQESLKTLKEEEIELNKLLKSADKKIETEITNAKKSNEEINITKKLSSEILEEIKNWKEEIGKYKVESEEDKTTISKILNLVTDTGLANSFDKRRKRTQNSMILWVSIMILGFIVTCLILFFAFINPLNPLLFEQINNDTLKFIYRITLTAPGVFLIWYSSIQYSKERFFLEQYEFKTATALALENYSKLIKERFPEEKYDKGRFKLMNDMICIIYKEPEYSKNKSSLIGKFKIPKVASEAGVELSSEEK